MPKDKTEKMKFNLICENHYPWIEWENKRLSIQDYVKMYKSLKPEDRHSIPSSLIAFLLQWTKTYDANTITTDQIIETVHPDKWNELKEHQKTAVIFGIKRQGRVLISLDQGLGKTRASLIIASFYRNQKSFKGPIMIFCLASTVESVWKQEIQQVLNIPEDRIAVPTTHQWLAHQLKAKDSYDFFIVSYGLTPDEDSMKRIQQAQFQFFILDESQTLQSITAKKTQYIAKCVKETKYVLALSGTPMNRPKHMYPQMFMLHPDCFDGFFKETLSELEEKDSYYYAWRYCQPMKRYYKKTKFNWVYDGATNLKELNALLNSVFMIRILKEEAKLNLPTKMRQRIEISLNLPEKEAEIAKELKAIHEVRQYDSKQAEARYMKLYHELPALKKPVVKTYVTQMLENGIFAQDKTMKWLIFGWFVDVLDSLEEIVKEHKIEYIRIDGSTSKKKRKEYLAAFQQEQGGPRIAILNMLSAGIGLNLHRANLVWIVDLNWNPSICLQAEDRSHRLTQVRPVLIQYLTAKNTIDDRIWTQLIQKSQQMANTLDHGKNLFQSEALSGSETGEIEEKSKKRKKSDVREQN